MRKVILDINGFKQESIFEEETINNVFIPLIEKLENIDQEKVIVYLAAPAGAGKSTIVNFLELLSKELGYNNIQAIGIDGFHYSNSYLKKTMGMVNGEKQLLMDVKGCPETFDIDYLLEKIKSLKAGDVKWPIYDRNIHDVIKDGVEVSKSIVLIEGNWLLLNENKWGDLVDLADYTIMIKADSNQLKSRLVNRKVKGKMTYDDAKKFVENSDLKNVKRVNENSKQADLYLELKDNNQLERIEYE
jgi:pantothenate kinase